jgi:hypothetical protein
MKIQSRRKFILQIAFDLVVLTLVDGIYALAEQKNTAPLPPGQLPLSDSDAVANALGYHPNAKNTDFKKYPQRKEPDAKNQFCKTCTNFTAVNEDWGKCVILSSGLVSSQGWCMSWTKKTT